MKSEVYEFIDSFIFLQYKNFDWIFFCIWMVNFGQWHIFNFFLLSSEEFLIIYFK